MKYVMFKITYESRTPQGEVEEHVMMPVVFPAHLVHSLVASAMLKSIQQHYPGKRVEAVSAGEVHSFDLSRVSGESTTLNLRHNPEDGVTLSTYDVTQGLV